MLEKGDYKSFYFFVSNAVREYIGRRYAIHALDSTTQELLYDLDAQPKGEEVIPLMKGFLTRCDLVKFAKFKPSLEQAEAAQEAAFTIVTVCEEVFKKHRIAQLGSINQ